MKKNINAAEAAAGPESVEAPALPDHALRDEFAGRGGSYTYDPVRGVRVPADVTEREAAEGVQGNE